MSVRRLAPAALQPDAFAFPADDQPLVDWEIGKYPEGRQASAVIALLWRAQKRAGGWLPQAAIEEVGRMLAMPTIRVLEVATFYTMFNLAPVGRHFVQVCGTTPCGLSGAESLKAVCARRIGEQRHVTEDGLFSWLEVECLGACCNAPMVQINDDYYEDLSPESFERLLDDLAAGRSVAPGSLTGRASSEPSGGATTLRDEALFDGSVVGAWRKRFEEEGAPAADEAKANAEAGRMAVVAAADPKPGKPDAGRPQSSPAADTPVQRVADGQAPIPAAERAHAADPSTSVRTPIEGEAAAPSARTAPLGPLSYVGTPAKLEDGDAGVSAPAGAGQAETANVEPGPALARAAGAGDPHPYATSADAPTEVDEEAEVAARLAALPKDAAPEIRADVVGTRPPAMASPQGGMGDDLTRIRGIGPVNERKLHGIGVYFFRQIAAWTPSETRWVGTYLAFPGRIDREDWIGQASALAAGPGVKTP